MASQSKLQSKLQLFEQQILNSSKDRIEYLKNGHFNATFYVKALHRQSKKWLKARVLDTRLSKDLDFLASDPKTHESYDYYVQFHGIDKRNDFWAHWSQIQTTFQKIQQDQQYEKFGKKNIHPNDDPHFGLSPLQWNYHKKITRLKTIQKIKLGGQTANTWYYSPYPLPYQNLQILYICQYCFSFYAKQSQYNYHDSICPLSHPPGNEIYRDLQHNISVFQIDGERNPTYCQNLAYFSKLYLNHKNLYLDMTIFIFYILCQIKNGQFNFAGYFSKAKLSHNNLSCILVSPFYQRKGYGKFMISLSYHLSWLDGMTGSPQKPFSDLGRQTYLSYWTKKIIAVMLDNPKEKKQLHVLRMRTGIASEDILWCLQKCKLITREGNQNNYIGNIKQLMAIYKATPDITIDVKPNNLHYVSYAQLKKEETKKNIKKSKKRRGKIVNEERYQPFLEKRIKGEQQNEKIE